MTIGERIKRIRKFRGMTQKDLAVRLDLGERGDNRLAQYEINYRVPKKELLDQIATALDISPLALYEHSGENASEIMEIFFWMEESLDMGNIRLFQMERISQKEHNEPEGAPVRYYDDTWPAHPPVGMYFDYTTLNGFMREWLFHKEELTAKSITKDEYFEWKIGWPYTCDDCGKRRPKKKWRKSKVQDAAQ